MWCKIKIGIAIVVTMGVTMGLVVGVGPRLKMPFSFSFSQEKPTVVRVETPQRGDLTEFINAPGDVEPKQKVEISAKVSARIVALPFKEGERVTKGQSESGASVLLKLDATDLEANLKSAEARRAGDLAQIDVDKTSIQSLQADIAGIQASLNLAKSHLERQKKLFNSKDIAEKLVEDAQSRVDELAAQREGAMQRLKGRELGLLVSNHRLEVAAAAITHAQEAVSYTTITSPIDGVVTKLNAEVGEMVMTGTMNNPGTVILEVADLSKMLVVARVDETDIGSLRQGQRAQVHIHAWPERIFKGTVETIALTSTDRGGGKYFEVKILLDVEGERLFSGLNADVDVEIRTHVNVMKVPSQAVLGMEIDELPVEIRDNSAEIDETKVFAAVVFRFIDGAAVVTPVTIGKSDATHTIILSGFTEENRIITGPYKVLDKMKHGQKVQDERDEVREDQPGADAKMDGESKI